MIILRHPTLGPGYFSSRALISAASTARTMGEGIGGNGDNDGDDDEEEEEEEHPLLAVSAVAR